MMQNNFEVLPMTPADVPAAFAVEVDVYADEAWPMEQLSDFVNNPGSYLWLAYLDGEAVGYCGMTDFTAQGHPYCKIGTMAVRKAFQGKGIGKALLQKMLDKAEELGIDRIKLEVRVGNDGAIGLYKSFDFYIEDKIADYYGEGKDGYVMWRTSEDGENDAK